MFGLDPEKILNGLMSSLGISAADFTKFIHGVATEINEMRADRLAFKPASIKAYQDITARLDRIELKLDRLLPDNLQIPAKESEPNERPTLNGHQHGS